jgi:hypothetical protein
VLQWDFIILELVCEVYLDLAQIYSVLLHRLIGDVSRLTSHFEFLAGHLVDVVAKNLARANVAFVVDGLHLDSFQTSLIPPALGPEGLLTIHCCDPGHQSALKGVSLDVVDLLRSFSEIFWP